MDAFNLLTATGHVNEIKLAFKSESITTNHIFSALYEVLLELTCTQW